MSTGHWNPGYGDIVSRFNRSKSSTYKYNGSMTLPGCKSLRQSEMDLDRATLDEIRRSAKDAWLRDPYTETSYQNHYKDRYSDVDEFTQARPTSASRFNKPHPHLIFLTTRLHNCPGFHNPDATLGKEAYQVDASLPPYEQARRNNSRSKYTARPNSGALRQHETMEELEAIPDPIERQGMEAYIKLSADTDKENLLASLKEIKDNNQNEEYMKTPSFRPRTTPSLHRYLKTAGVQEADHLDTVHRKYLYGAPPNPDMNDYSIGPVTSDDVLSKRAREIENMGKGPTRYVQRSKRGDFLMHPQWPPSFTHHRLNGLSSVDLPYTTSRR